jgi:hypothetical protein
MTGQLMVDANAMGMQKPVCLLRTQFLIHAYKPQWFMGNVSVLATLLD